MPTDNDQGGHEVMHVATRECLTHHVVTQLPLPTTVIQAIEALAHKQGMKGLQFKTKDGQILWDSAWIAGVDYDEDDEDQDYDDKDVKLPGVNIDKEEEEQIWEDLDENEVTRFVRRCKESNPTRATRRRRARIRWRNWYAAKKKKKWHCASRQ